MASSRPRGRPPGTTKPNTADSVINFRIPRREKSGWVKRAQAAGMTLSAWIRERCQ